MLPVVRGERETARSIVRYPFLLVAVTLLPVVWRTLGVVYLGVALALGRTFLWLAFAFAARNDTAACAPALQLLARLPRPAVRRHGHRPARPVTEPNAELARKNLRWGVGLFVLALILFAGSIAVAEIYNRLSG